MHISSIFVFDGNNSVLKNATRWDSKRRVIHQGKFSPQGWLGVIIELLGKPEVNLFSLLFKQLQQ
jgi:hypothetical protein